MKKTLFFASLLLAVAVVVISTGRFEHIKPKIVAQETAELSGDGDYV